jgi:hypothetical protein
MNTKKPDTPVLLPRAVAEDLSETLAWVLALGGPPIPELARLREHGEILGDALKGDLEVEGDPTKLLALLVEQVQLECGKQATATPDEAGVNAALHALRSRADGPAMQLEEARLPGPCFAVELGESGAQAGAWEPYERQPERASDYLPRSGELIHVGDGRIGRVRALDGIIHGAGGVLVRVDSVRPISPREEDEQW